MEVLLYKIADIEKDVQIYKKRTSGHFGGHVTCIMSFCILDTVLVPNGKFLSACNPSKQWTHTCEKWAHTSGAVACHSGQLGVRCLVQGHFIRECRGKGKRSSFTSPALTFCCWSREINQRPFGHKSASQKTKLYIIMHYNMQNRLYTKTWV